MFRNISEVTLPETLRNHDLNNLGNLFDADRKKLEDSVELEEPDIVVWDLEGMLDGSSGKIL